MPTEILFEILTHLSIDEPCQQRTRILLVNKRMHALVQHQYGKNGFIFRDGDPYLFLRTLIEHPEAGARVLGLHASSPPQKPYVPKPVDKQIVQTAMEALEIPDARLWADACNSAASGYNPDFIQTAIMMHTPNLANLMLPRHFVSSMTSAPWVDLLRQSVAGNSFGRVHRFDRLCFVYVAGAPTLRLRNLIYLFRLPAIKSLMLSHVFQLWRAPRIPWSILSQPSTITQLSMMECFLSTNVIIELVKACPALTYLAMEQNLLMPTIVNMEYIFDPDDEGGPGEADGEDGGGVLLNYARLTDVLVQQCKDLTYLHIHESMEESQRRLFIPDATRASITIRSLVSLSIQRLELPLVALVDPRDPDQSAQLSVSRLPNTLLELKIQDVYWDRNDHVSFLLRHLLHRVRDGQLPLKDLSVATTRTTGLNAAVFDPIEHCYSKLLKELGVDLFIEHPKIPVFLPLGVATAEPDEGIGEQSAGQG